MIDNMKRNNDGFSLVEMVVTVLISGILMLAVGVFMSISNDMFQAVNASSKVQDEAQTTKNFLSEIMYEAVNVCESEDSASTKYWIIKSMNNDDASDKLETSGSSVNYDYYVFVFNNNKLHYIKIDPGDESRLSDICPPTQNIITSLDTDLYNKYVTNEKDSNYNVISNYLEEFDIASSNNELFDVTAKYKYIQKEYSANFTVHSRNRTEDKWK